MIRVVINGEEQEFEDGQFKNFKELYDHVKPPGRVLARLVVNGSEIPIARVSELFNSYFEGGETVEMEFVSVKDAAKNLIESGREYIQRAKSIITKIPQQLLVDEKAGFEAVAMMAEGLGLLEEMRDGLSRALGLTLEELGLSVDFSKSVNILKALSEALKARDVVAISDIIDEELVNVYDSYLRFFEKVEDFLTGVS
ncbi:MAG: hypothetical protein PWP37_738 [Thermotogota bacterium]|nr:hypothetical protein [Thermotogota bacterium]MDK2864546.1 hypothetical protein [Thermotogota bacterium]HCZ06329.1 hypothetical protein [Thermotogota bacterium]